MMRHDPIRAGSRPALPLAGLVALLIAWPAPGQTPATAPVPDKTLDKADLLPDLEQIRQQYPRLYDRLRRETPRADLATVGAQHRSRRAVPVDALLRQEVRGRSGAPRAAAGKAP